MTRSTSKRAIEHQYKKAADEVREMIAKNRRERKSIILLTKRTVFAILKKFKRNKQTQESKVMEKTKKTNKKRTVEVRMLIPYGIIFSIVLLGIGIYTGISYTNHVDSLVQERAAVLSKTNVQ